MRLRLARYPVLLIAALCLAIPARAQFVPAGGAQGERRDRVLESLHQKAYPPTGPWSFLGQALASYWVGDPEKGDAAIAALGKMGVVPASEGSGGDEEGGSVVNHWHIFQLARIVFLFGHHGVHRPGAMGLEAEAAAKNLLWSWLAPRGCRRLAAPENDWLVWRSENHHLQAWFSLWGAAALLADDPAYRDRAFSDGSTVAEMKTALDAYFKRWIRNRATRGIFVECGSPTYAKYSVSGFYNFVDFSDDPELRELARRFLDLIWAQWALEQIDGNRAGSRHRSYSGTPSIDGESLSVLAGYHFPGAQEPSSHPAGWCTATSSYVPPDLVKEIAARRGELGTYEISSRLPGLLRPGRSGPANFVEDKGNPFYDPRGVYDLDPQCGSLLRKTYAEPGFILGTSMVPALPADSWSAISSQNRWDGAMFAGPRASCIFVQPARPPKGSLYNTEWSVQERGVLLIQRLKAADGARNQMMWFSGDLRLSEQDGWILAEAANAYAAVKVVKGEWTWEDKPEYWRDGKNYKPGIGKWLIPRDEFSPLILEVASRSAYPDLPSFGRAVAGNVLTSTSQRTDYTSAYYKTTLTLFTDFSRPPRIDGGTIAYDSPQCFDGGVLDAPFGGDTVRVKAFGRELVLDFGGK